MEATDSKDDFIAARLASLGIEADETDLAVIAAVHQIFWPPIQSLLAFDLGDVVPEPNLDLSRAPR
jgi:hypothetical protein